MCRYLYQVFLLLLCALLPTCSEWKATFNPSAVTINTGSYLNVQLVLSGLSSEAIANINDQNYVKIRSENDLVAKVPEQKIIFSEIAPNNGSFLSNIDIKGVFIGQTKIIVELRRKVNVTEQAELDVTILRPQRVIDKIFTYSIVVIITLLYVNFGAAINMSIIKSILKRPVGPAICFMTQFLMLPVAAYFLGVALFPLAHELALGLFFIGISPGGGASNMFTLLLDGNFNLSVTMTTISTLASFVMTPLWIFTLGKTIFDRANLGVPYSRIAMMAVGLLVPLGIGLLIRQFMPKTTKFLVRILKPVSLSFNLVLIVFGIISNTYIFHQLSWQIVVAGMALPWLGYSIGWFTSKIFTQNYSDSIAIAIETGIQNIGFSFFLLQFALDQPIADLTTVIPGSVAIMTPFPLLGLYLIKKCKQYRARKDSKEENQVELRTNITTLPKELQPMINLPR